MPDRSPIPIQFTHKSEIINAKLLYNPSQYSEIMLVKLDEIHPEFNMMITLFKEEGYWRSDEFNTLYPETIDQLDKIIKVHMDPA